MDGLTGSYMPSGLSPAQPGQMPLGMGSMGVNQGYMSGHTSASVPSPMGNYPASSISSGYMNPYVQFQGLGKFCRPIGIVALRSWVRLPLSFSLIDWFPLH